MASSKLIRNERVKALASLMNNLAAAAIVTAVLVPLVAANMTAPGDAIPLGYLVTVPIGLVLALALAGFAYVILGHLEE